MTDSGSRAERELTALMIAPDRALAQQFTSSLSASRAFQVLSDLKEYPPAQVLKVRLRQLQPNVLLLDIATDLAAAGELIRLVAEASPGVHVVGLHTRNDSEAIVKSLRMGASEFLCAPFDPGIQAQAVARLRRLLEPQMPPAALQGRVLVFTSAKPGSGASTLAAQSGFALRRLTEKRVLLADLDLLGGATSFYLKLAPKGSLLDLIEHGQTAENWEAMALSCHGLDVLAAPEVPAAESVDPARLGEFLAHARQRYEWVMLDLPAVFNRLSLLALSEADLGYLISTAELPSLHLARKAVNLLAHVGIGRERFRVLINRTDKRGLCGSDVEKIVNCPVEATFPNDYASLDRAVTLGEPLAAACDLGRSIEAFARKMAAAAPELAGKAG